MIEAVELAAGVILVVWMLNDIFQSVVVPRPTPGTRPTNLVVRLTWPAWRDVALGRAERERLLGTYASVVLIAVLAIWIAGLIVGFGLVFHALRAELDPVPTDLLGATYFAATSLLTIGFGDIVATGPEARVLAVVAGAMGLGVVALSISFVFSLFGSFQRREALVVTLDQRAGAPPSGVRLLETYARERMVEDLGRTFADWERWAGEVLDSHISYPILAYFRSTHDNESWVSAIGAMLDAATLVVTTIEDGPTGQARMLTSAGNHLLEDITQAFRITYERNAGVERSEFDDARERLASCGYRLRDTEESWRRFAETRAGYAGALNALARFWAVPPALWVGDRSYLPLHPGR